MRNLDKFQEMTGKETFKDHLMRVPAPSKLEFTILKGGKDQGQCLKTMYLILYEEREESK